MTLTCQTFNDVLKFAVVSLETKHTNLVTKKNHSTDTKTID